MDFIDFARSHGIIINHRDIRKEFGIEPEIEFTETIKTGIAQDDRRRCEI